MLILDWKYDPNTQISSVDLDVEPPLRYETPDGGQTITKFVNGVATDTFHMFGPDRKFLSYNADPNCGMSVTDFDTNWPAELDWLLETFAEIVDVDVDPKYQTNRMCVNGAVQSWSDYNIIAESPANPDPLCYGQGLVWRQHKTTGKIYRCARGQPQIPDSMYPKIYGPFEITTLDDIAEHAGTML